MANSLHAHTAAGVTFSASDALAVTQVCGVDGLLGESVAMHTLFGQIRRVATMGVSLLIIGESGTGKELVAKCLHELSQRAPEPFLIVDCGAVAPSQFEAELFGHQPDAAPAAWAALGSQAGYFERVGAGSLLLDEITEMPLDVQAKLLRVLESGRFPQVGAETDVQCRVLATTSRDPRQALADGQLRADLLHRLAVFPMVIPPLREREDDAQLLAHFFLKKLNAEEGTSKRFSADSLLHLRQYSWPGNVRELRNAVERAFILAEGDLDLRAAVDKPLILSALGDDPVLRIPVGTRLAEAERWMILATLKKCGGNKTRAAALLGVSLKTLYNRLNAYRARGLDVSDLDRELTEVAS